MTMVPKSLFEVAHFFSQGEKFQLCLGNFLDWFKSNGTFEALSEEPMPQNFEIEVFLAATAAQLAKDNGWKTPEWANHPEKVIEPPRFPTNNKQYREELLKECPEEFKRRGLIISANALSRC
jgi:hypothetical protein